MTGRKNGSCVTESGVMGAPNSEANETFERKVGIEMCIFKEVVCSAGDREMGNVWEVSIGGVRFTKQGSMPLHFVLSIPRCMEIEVNM